VAEARTAASELLAALCRRRGRWNDLLGRIAEPGESERKGLSSRVERLLWEGVAALLCTEVVADICAAQTRVAGRGPWLYVGYNSAPAADWLADEVVLDAVRGLVAPADTVVLRRLAGLVYGEGTSALPGALTWWLDAQLLTTATGIPALALLLAGTPALDAAIELRLGPDGERAIHDVTHALAWLAVLLTHHRVMAAERRDLAAAPYLAILPALARYLRAEEARSS
jgi:hypothetical protein